MAGTHKKRRMVMKKVLALVAAASLIAAASAAFAAPVTIKGSKHDLSQLTGTATITKGANTQICIYCHAPHGAGKPELLWNRTNPEGTDFTLYQIINGANDNVANLSLTSSSSSLFCMSCHDGSLLMNNVTHTPAATTLSATGGALSTGSLTSSSANLGKNLTNTHPINFPVNSNSQNDLFITSPATAKAMGGGAGTASDAFPLFQSVASSTTNWLECGSCHAVHDSQFVPFLRTTLQSSTLCLGCHNK